MTRQPEHSINEDRQEGLSCVHCGKKATKPIYKNGEVFCCNGCLRVYEMMKEAEACPIPEDGEVNEQAYHYFDLPEYRERFMRSDGEGHAQAVFFLPDMNCASCVQFLEQLHYKHSGIRRSEVNFPKKEVRILFDESELKPSELAILLATLGYPPEIRQETEKKSNKRSRRLVTQIGVAGFCFGNIMLFSFPEYLGGENLEENFKRWFAFLNMALSLPVMLYSGREYLGSAYTALKNKTVNIDVPVSIGMLAIFFRSSWEVIMNTGTGYFDSLAGLVFFLLIGRWYQARTYGALSYDRDYKSYFPIAVQRKQEGGDEFVPIADLQTGDTIIIHHQEIIPCDSTLVEGNARIDYSFVTGESDPIKVSAGEQVQAGGRQTGASITLEVAAPVEQSKLTRLWNSEAFLKDQGKSIEDPVNRISKHFTWIVIAIGLGAFIYWIPNDEAIAWNAFTATLIVACPCALALTLPFTFGSTMRLMGKAGMYLKNTSVIESMARLKHLVFDKTGTLTRANDYRIAWHGEALSQEALQMIVSAADQSAHPLSRALTRTFREDHLKLDQFEELPGKGIIAIEKGNKLEMGSAEWLQVSKAEVNGSQVHIRLNGTYLGCFSFDKPLREGLSNELADLKAHYDLHLLSGDNANEASRYAEIFDAHHMHFERSPEDKMAFVNSLSDQSEKNAHDKANVAMIGDGLNDAGALRAADVGIAVVDDLYAFSPACDAIMHAGALKQLDDLLSLSRKAMQTVRLSFLISFVYNAIGIAFAVQGLLTPLVAAVLMPLSSVTVVLFTVLSSHYHFRKLRLERG